MLSLICAFFALLCTRNAAQLCTAGSKCFRNTQNITTNGIILNKHKKIQKQYVYSCFFSTKYKQTKHMKDKNIFKKNKQKNKKNKCAFTSQFRIFLYFGCNYTPNHTYEYICALTPKTKKKKYIYFIEIFF